MNTLSNVSLPGGKVKPSSIEFTLDAFPEAKSSQTGVSSRYVYDPNKHWFVFRATYGREEKAADILIANGTYAYLPKRYTKKLVNGKMKRVLVPLIPNLLFAYTTEEEAESYKHRPGLSFLGFYHNKFDKDWDGKGKPLKVPTHEMENFIRATSTMSEHLMMINPEQCHFKGGETVRIIDGLFKGVEGRIARVSGQQRVIVSVSNVGFVSTAYIPTAFIQIIESLV